LQAGGNYTIANAAQLNSSGGTIDSNGYTFTYSGNIVDTPANTGSLTIKDSTADDRRHGAFRQQHLYRLHHRRSGTLKAGSATGLSQNSAVCRELWRDARPQRLQQYHRFARDGAFGGGTVTNNGASNTTLTAGATTVRRYSSGTIQDAPPSVA